VVAPAHDKLKADGTLGPRSEAALRDAYLAMVTVKVEAARFMGPQTAGCSEFNRAGGANRDRRVVLAVYGPDFPTESRIPCKAGDAASCKINKKAPHPWKCNFYRRTLDDERRLEAPPLPARIKLLAQTVDELGFRLGNQPLVFVDEAGPESFVATDDKGVFDGFVQSMGGKLSVRLPDGSIQLARDGTFNQPTILDLVVHGQSPEQPSVLHQQQVFAGMYERTPPDIRRPGRVAASTVAGEPWSDIGTRTEPSE